MYFIILHFYLTKDSSWLLTKVVINSIIEMDRIDCSTLNVGVEDQLVLVAVRQPDGIPHDVLGGDDSEGRILSGSDINMERLDLGDPGEDDEGGVVCTGVTVGCQSPVRAVAGGLTAVIQTQLLALSATGLAAPAGARPLQRLPEHLETDPGTEISLDSGHHLGLQAEVADTATFIL